MHQANNGAKVSKNVSPKKHVATAPLKHQHMPFLLQSAYKIQRMPFYDATHIGYTFMKKGKQ